MITVGDNFNYQGRKPLDSRIQFTSVANMKAYPDASLYDGCIAYVTANKKNYQYDSNNTVDTTTGKWREFEAGGGGGSIPAGGTTGQALLKASNADEDVTWGNVVDANAFHTDEQISDVVDDVSYFPYMYTVGQSFYKYRMSWSNVKSKLKTYFDQYYSGGGGTSDYTDLTNKPQIEGVTLTGNKAVSSFGLTSSVETQYGGSSTKSYVTRGEKYDWNTGNTVYGTCSTSASTTNKSVTISRGTFNFTAGARIAIQFSYNNTASAPTLTVGSTTKDIKYINSNGEVSTPTVWWSANDIVEFVYDGTQFLMQSTTGMMFKIQGATMKREDIYSESEKVVGCWIDGRPIYQKTISFGTLPNTSSKTVSHGISNIRTVISAECCSQNGTPMISMSLPLPYSTPNNLNQQTSLWIDSTYIHVESGIDLSSLTYTYVTVKYTKTTDAANSFNYADPNDYSTTEKIVGTWIDGKPLYQKTINFGALPSSSSGYTKSVSLGVSNARVKEIKGYAYNGTLTVPIAFTGSSSGASDLTSVAAAMNSQIIVYFDGTSFVIYTGKDRTDYTECYLTVKYTK